jgi:hypothetical protein
MEISGLNQRTTSVTFAAMNFLLASLAWLVIGILLGLGIWLWVAKGVIWVMLLVIVGLVVAIGKIGCSTH